MIDAFLALGELKKSNTIQSIGGLGGIILDGEPGIGKSELVIHALRARGYQEQHQKSHHSKHPVFYRLPASMPLDEKERLLRKAFDEGAVVVADEINSSSMMEYLLNALLMGRTPEGQTATTPGFMIIGTQNPITMGGRRAPSTALSRRLSTLYLEEYTTEEMQRIIKNKGVSADEAEKMVQAYTKQKSIAKDNNYKPAPTFRDLLKLATQVIHAKKAAEHSKGLLTTSRNEPTCLNIVTQLIDNIVNKKNNRILLSSIDMKQKIKKLTAIQTWLTQKKDPLSSDEEIIILALIRDVCAIKRNPVGFFAPHSLIEFKQMITPGTFKKLHGVCFSREDLDCLDPEKLDAINGLIIRNPDNQREKATRYKPQ